MSQVVAKIQGLFTSDLLQARVRSPKHAASISQPADSSLTARPSCNGETRRIGPELLRDHLAAELESAVFLVAGPPAMVDAVVAALGEVGVPEERIRPDRFSGY